MLLPLTHSMMQEHTTLLYVHKAFFPICVCPTESSHSATYCIYLWPHIYSNKLPAPLCGVVLFIFLSPAGLGFFLVFFSHLFKSIINENCIYLITWCNYLAAWCLLYRCTAECLPHWVSPTVNSTMSYRQRVFYHCWWSVYERHLNSELLLNKRKVTFKR